MSTETRVTRKRIEELIPHRDPFIFVDEIDVSAGDIRGIRRFTGEEFFFAGHFPGHPVVPGVILVETLAQCGGAGVRLLGLGGPGTFFFAKIREARFRRPVAPGDELTMTVENIRVTPSVVHQRGMGSVGGELAVEAEWIALLGVAEGGEG